MIRPPHALLAILLASNPHRGIASNTALPREVRIVGRNYAFTAPSELASGQISFRFTNKGTVDHELDLALLKDGVSAEQLMAAVNTKQPLKPMIESSVGILLATPGQRSHSGLSTELLANRNYLVICRMQDSASAPMHSRMGMVSVIHVSTARAPAPPPSRVDTITGMNYAFRVPRTLAAGSHTIAFVNAGTVNHEANVMLVRRGVAVERVLEVARRDGDLHNLIDEFAGVLVVKAGSSPLGMLRMTLYPGREYVILCQLTDDEKSPSHVTLGMFASIRVSPTGHER